jgi:cytochrome c556
VEVKEMEKPGSEQPPADGATGWRAAIEQIFDQMVQADVRIQNYQVEIDRLKAETRAMLAEMKEQMRDLL